MSLYKYKVVSDIEIKNAKSPLVICFKYKDGNYTNIRYRD